MKSVYANVKLHGLIYKRDAVISAALLHSFVTKYF